MTVRKCKTTSFDLSDAYEAELLRHAEDQGNYSRYVKRLIARDKEGVPTRISVMSPDVVEENADDIEAINGYL